MDEENEYGRYEIDGYDDLNEWETEQCFQDSVLEAEDFEPEWDGDYEDHGFGD